MKLNLGDVEAWTAGGILPPGQYVCVVDTAKEGQSSNGHLQLELDLRCVEGDFQGGTVRDWVVVTEKSLGRVRQVLEAFGVEIPAGEFDFDPATLVDKRALVFVQEHEWNGEKRTKVAAYDSPDAARSDMPGFDNGGDPVAAGSGASDPDIPFRRPLFPEFGVERTTWPRPHALG